MTTYDAIIKEICCADKEEREVIFIQLLRLAKADGIFDDAEKNMILRLMRNYEPSQNYFYKLLASTDEEFDISVVNHTDHMLLYMIMLAYIDGMLSKEEWHQIKKTAESVKIDHNRLSELYLIVKRKLYNTMLRQIYSARMNNDMREKFLSDVREYLNLPDEYAALEENSVTARLGKRVVRFS
jgi:uncharacterized tellurite resistance protein B-like protein